MARGARQPRPAGGEDAIRQAIAGAEEFAGDEAGGGRDRRLAGKLMNDSGNAERFRQRHGRNFLYVEEMGWLGWTGSHWSLADGHNKSRMAAQDTARKIFVEADQLEDPGAAKKLRGWALESGNGARLAQMTRLAEPYLARSVGELDPDPFLLNCQNGALELPRDPAKPVRLRRHSRLDLATRVTPIGYDPEASCPLFRQFLAQILPDPELQIFVQVWFGYCLTGDYSEHKLAMFWGEGRNGKGVLTKLQQWLAGDYAAIVQFSSLLDDRARRGSEPSPDLAKLPGARVVFAGEPKKGQRLDDGLVKQITGGDDLTVRRLNRDPFDLKPTFKLTLSFNNKPRIHDDTHGMWSRILLVPFVVTIAENQQDPNLLGKLKAEGPGVLNWALDGFRMWREQGLQTPQAVLAATAGYRSESDDIGLFLATATTRGDQQNAIRSTQLYDCYKGWAAAMDKRAVSQTKFGIELTKRGHPGLPDNTGLICRHGLKWAAGIDWDWQGAL